MNQKLSVKSGFMYFDLQRTVLHNLINKTTDFADEHSMFPGSGLVMACVSGGADSMCLLDALLEISRLRGFGVCVAHYNHMLRGGESDRDEAFVRTHCEIREVPFYSGSGDVRAYAKENGIGIEEAARDMRYGYFFEAALETGAAVIATAHTADDNAETMLLNFVRGAGPAGLSGIPPVRGMVVRPMLKVSRDEVLSYAGERGVSFVEDSTNELDIYTRNRLRRAVMPVLRELNPRLGEAAASAAAVLRADEVYLSGAADEFIKSVENQGNSEFQMTRHSSEFRIPNSEFQMTRLSSEFRIPNSELLALPFAVSSRVIRKLCNGRASYGHVKSVLELCGRDTVNASLSLPGMTVYKEYGNIVFVPGGGAAPGGFDPVYPEDGSRTEIPGTGLFISCKFLTCGDTIYKSLTTFLFQSIDLCGRIAVRPRLEGDTIRLLGHGQTKSLKKLFIERRVPVRKRNLIPVVADDKGVLAVYGIGAGDRAAPVPGSRVLQIDFEEKR